MFNTLDFHTYHFGVRSTVLGLMLLAGGCDAPSEGAVTLRGAGDGLEKTLEIEFDGTEGELLVPIAVAELIEHGSFTLLMDTTDGWTDFIVETELGEFVAASEHYEVFDEGNGGTPRYVTRLELNPSWGADLVVRATVDTNVAVGSLVFCDEVVTNRADQGAGSLRDAIGDVRAFGSVCFDPQQFEDPALGPVVLQSQIDTSHLTIIGTTPVAPVVTSNFASRIFFFGGETTVRRVHLRDGSEAWGGLIYTEGMLDLEEVTLEGGMADRGGAVYSYFWGSGDPLQITDSVILNNTATEGGGGVWTEAPTTITNTTMAHNTAPEGGALYVYHDTVLSGVSVHDNEAEDGGGIKLSGWYLDLYAGTQVYSNNATRGGGIAADQGGTVWMSGDSSIEGNTATWRGGGAAVLDAANLQMLGDATVDGNHSEADGGGVFVEGSLVVQGHASVSNNTAERHGGGVFNEGSTSLQGLYARVNDNDAATVDGSGQGGGVYTVCNGLSYVPSASQATGNSPDNIHEACP